MKKNRIRKIRNYYFGIIAEKVAIILLLAKGYKILAMRHKTPFGEIDIIAKKGKILVISEVKARKFIGNIEEVLNWHQIGRIKAAAQFFVSKNKSLQNCDIRFDFFAVSRFLFVKHYKNFIS